MSHTPRTVDSHHHLWTLGKGAYGWLGDDPSPINRTFEYSEAEPLAEAAGVDAVVLVQADNTIADTDAMLAAAEAWPRVAGVVGWAPLIDTEALPAVLERFVANPRMVGLRHLNHDEANPRWLEREDVLAGLALLERTRLNFDVVAVLPEHLASVPVLAQRFPDLTIVIDHLAKPPIADGGWEPWAHLLTDAARLPNVVAKLSGLNTAADPANCTAAAMSRYVDHALDTFGADRLMFGSDWPVSELVGGYAAWWGWVGELIAGASDTERAAILGGTAERVYALGPA